jgi:hypothetical protein
MGLRKYPCSLPYPIQQPSKYIYGAIPFSSNWERRKEEIQEWQTTEGRVLNRV